MPVPSQHTGPSAVSGKEERQRVVGESRGAGTEGLREKVSRKDPDRESIPSNGFSEVEATR